MAALSVGTRDQLATLIRLALAAQLKSAIVLDDQLTQADEHRLAFFHDCLRASVGDHGHQIIVFTCRPEDYVGDEEMPSPPCDRFQTEDGTLTVVNLEGIVTAFL